MEEKDNIISQTPDNQESVTPPAVEAPVPSDPKETKEVKKGWSLGRMFQSILDGTFLTRDNMIRSIPYLFFVALLGLMYISNTYYAEKTVRSIDKTKNELKELRYEHITVKSELMYLSKQSEVTKRLEGTGLKPSVTPPLKIFTDPEKKEAARN
jgi:hypothetical protein